MKVREVVRTLERDGWPNPAQDMAPGTLANIFRQARLTKEDR